MMKKSTICLATLALAVGITISTSAVALDKGPENMVLQAVKNKARKAKPAIFPHAAHQERLECGACHHSKDANGKQVAYVEGQKIEKCESCHFKGSGMPTKKDKKAKKAKYALNTYKMAAHANCKTCHKAEKKKNKALKKTWKRCLPCHVKKKK